ncbi:MAG TPA: hypothetical protein IAA29_10285 [Candidatus Paenibacillus intestinavium]|nr:hypothetical protein [Candidatus Paenibacillus intestinavium]
MLNKIEAHRYMYCFLKRKVTLFELEQWIYDHEELEEFLGEANYFQLISRDYKNKYAFEDTEKQIRKLNDIGLYEQERVVNLLISLTESHDDEIDVLDVLYDEYCDGYTFLRYIALTHVGTSDEYKENLKRNNTKLKDYNESIIREAKRLLNFFDRNELEITIEHEYIDLRKEEDKIEIHSINEMFNERRDT